MKTLSTRILRFAQVSLLGLFTAQAAIAANPVPDFAKVDTNKDGAVSLQEFATAGGKEDAFHASDANGDGMLSPDEFAKAASGKDRAKPGAMQ